MRRRLLGLLPALTKFYGLMPWDVERLTFDELNVYVTQYRQHLKQEAASGPQR